MNLGVAYWIVILLMLIFSVWTSWPSGAPENRNFRPLGGSVLLFLALFLLGWQVFGAPLHK